MNSMNTDLAYIFKDARNLLNTWKMRYTPQEYPYKVVLNIFYKKYTIEKIWPMIINRGCKSFDEAYERNAQIYSQTAPLEIVPILEANLRANQPVCRIKFSDFQSYIQSAAQGNADAIRGIEYTYMLNRFLDELVMLWIALVNSGETKISAVAKLTGAVIAAMPINSYLEIEQILDQLGTEQYLQSYLLKEIKNQL